MQNTLPKLRTLIDEGRSIITGLKSPVEFLVDFEHPDLSTFISQFEKADEWKNDMAIFIKKNINEPDYLLNQLNENINFNDLLVLTLKRGNYETVTLEGDRLYDFTKYKTSDELRRLKIELAPNKPRGKELQKIFYYKRQELERNLNAFHSRAERHIIKHGGGKENKPRQSITERSGLDTGKEQDCFVIMQIGSPQLDNLWEKAYKPVIEGLSFKAVRIDAYDDGTLLKQQIIQYLHQASLIIADLTNERPNCYLEAGYVMGLNRHKDLILCCREDHNIESPNHVQGGPKVHFDLQGYYILWWSPENLEEFKQDLEEKIRRRTKPPRHAIQVSAGEPRVREIRAWIEEQRREVFKQ